MMRVKYNLPMAGVMSIIRYWWPSVLVMGVIFAFSSIPSNDLPKFGWVDIPIKKSGHALGYGLLALAYLRGLKGGSRDLSFAQILGAWVLATIYSATDELHQSFVPGRYPAITDVFIDSAGAAISLYIAYRYLKQKDQPDRLVSDI